MAKKYINYKDSSVYALYYKENDTVYYNLNFSGKTKIILYR